jgi:sigma-B regulation protein RsbQ
MSHLARNNVRTAGEGARPLVLVHGFGCDQNMWRHVAPALGKDHRLVTLDLTGMGRSDLSAYDFSDYATLDRHAGDVVAIMEELDLSDAVLIGHSVGATIAALAANRAPERTRAVALIAPSPCFLNDEDYRGGFDREALIGIIDLMDQNFLGWVEQMAPVIAGQDKAQPGGAELNESFCQTDPSIAKHFGRVTFLSDHREDMKSLSHPALVIECTEDALVPASVGEWLERNLPAGRLHMLDAKGHCPHLTDPAATAAVLVDFLGTLR